MKNTTIMLKKIARYYHTLKYLRLVQFRYRAYYLVRAKFRKLIGFNYQFSKKTSEKQQIIIENSIEQHENWISGNEFQFLNKKHDFKATINWNFADFGKLWTYNLCYFEFLAQKTMDKATGLRLIRDFIQKLPTLKDANEPFPTALRLMYWTKFLAKNQISDPTIDESLLAQACILSDNLEYHLLGNHLLEDGFGLLSAAYYFQDDALYDQAKRILLPELNEQILADGAHFELSPMYHQHILFRVLDAINIIQNNDFYKKSELRSFFTKKAEIMLGWLAQMTFRNGDIPMLNDSAPQIAPTSQQLFDYAKQLKIAAKVLPLQHSGYRKWTTDRMEVVMDVGNVAPDYIPGHAHSDTFGFVLTLDNQPFIVDRGISTYEANGLRQLERSTASHNTMRINGEEQTDVWGGFRVARRAKAQIIVEEEAHLQAQHDGYKHLGITHERLFSTNELGQFCVSDMVFSDKEVDCRVFLHFHPTVKVLNQTETTLETNIATIQFGDVQAVELGVYDYCNGFNQTTQAVSIAYKINAAERQAAYYKHQETVQNALNTPWYPLPVFNDVLFANHDITIIPNG